MHQFEAYHTYLIDPDWTDDPENDFIGKSYGEEHDKIILRQILYEGAGPSFAIGYQR